MTRVFTFDTRHSVREAFPTLCLIMIVMLIIAPVGFVPEDWLHVPRWFRLMSGVSIITFVMVGVKWKQLYPIILGYRAGLVSRLPGMYAISWEEGVQLRVHHVQGVLIHFRGLDKHFMRFDHDHDRVLFLIGRQ
jgi:hypothetical protein